MGCAPSHGQGNEVQGPRNIDGKEPRDIDDLEARSERAAAHIREYGNFGGAMGGMVGAPMYSP